MSNPDDKTNSAQLHKQAENKKARKKVAQSPEKLEALSPAETRQMLHKPRESVARLRAELHEGVSLQSLLLDNIGAGIAIIDAETHIIERVNKKGVELFAGKEDQIIGQVCHCFLCPAEKGKCPVSDLGQEVDNSDRILLRADGSQLPIMKSVRGILIDGKDKLLETFTDISERKHAEEELARSEERYRNILSNMQDAYFELDLAGNYTFINEATCSSLGYTKEELIGQSFRIIATDENQRDIIFQAYNKVFKTGAPNKGFAFKVIRKDGSDGYVETSISLLKDQQGKTIGFCCLARDVTEKKKSEKELARSEERYRNILSNMQDPYFELDLGGNFTFLNEATFSSLGYTREELIGQSFRFISAGEDEIKNMIEAYNKVYRTGKPNKGFAFRVLGKAGNTGYAETSISLLKDEHGNPIGFSSVSRDVTEKKRAEEKIRESEELYRLLSEHTTDSVWIMDMNLKTTYHSPSVEKIRGFTPQEIMGMTLEQNITPTSLKLISDVFLKELPLIETRPGYNPSVTLDIEYYCKNGTTRWAENKFSIIRDLDGKALSILGEARDITERKHAEDEGEKLQEQLIQAQKMESVGRLAGGVAHDFNNMLGVILGHAELALMRTDPELPIYHDLQEIRKAAERSADLTRQLLAFARKQTVAPKVLDLNDTVEGMLKMLRRLIGEDIDLAWLPGKNLSSVKVDPSQVDQILANLIVNAHDAIVGGGKVTIETGNTFFDEAFCADHAGFVSGDYVLLTVSDNGCGMDKVTLANIFEPFFTTKGVGEGTGLGLATVYGIVKQNNGFINVYSEPDQGTTFKIYLPRYEGITTQLQAKGPSAPVERGQETILLVEDEPAILNMTTTMLQQLGYTGLAASGPGEAIRLAETYLGEMHLLITDVVMPDMNGRELARSILSLYPNLKLLFMSGYTADVIAHHGVLEKGVNFIQKPFSMQDLAAKVREVLDSK
jgi:two-component system, cell cycle sensor histidine kinase and response regulator CckA